MAPMVSWREEIERREAAARAEISELRSRMEELAGRLAEREAVLSRLEITWETMTEILSGDGAVTVSVGEAAGEVPVSVDRSRAGSLVGVRLVPQREPGLEADVLPRSYRDVVEVLQDAVHPMRAHHLCAALGLSTDKNKVEGFRSKLKRLVERGWLAEDEPGLFARGGARVRRSRKPRPTGDVAPVWSRALVSSVDGANQIATVQRREPDERSVRNGRGG
ncbi:hypothetical protein OG410_00640 [Streptomyces sp. NBC_00659]|uniref:hypothetical protein n=1 Tax=Streptomyces sp. NBC_00659 TaxID=2903669 RepID=UPI002E352FC2|nr:hypothetical protein [Streptomyces sp. NBC_00659]